MFASFITFCLELFDSLSEAEHKEREQHTKRQKPREREKIIPWSVAEKECWPIADFKKEIEKFASFFVERGCQMEIWQKEMAVVVGPAGHVVAHLRVIERQGEPAHIHIEYLSGVISQKGETELRGNERIVAVPVLALWSARGGG